MEGESCTSLMEIIMREASTREYHLESADSFAKMEVITRVISYKENQEAEEPAMMQSLKPHIKDSS